MNLKDHSVNMDGVHGAILYAMSLCEEILKKYGPFVCTSAKDGQHSKNSLHYVGLAFDMRTWAIPHKEERDSVIMLMQTTLGKDYEVFDEDSHFHVEVSPQWLSRNGDPRKVA